MSDVDQLLNRIDAEFAAAQEKVKEFRGHQLEAYHARQKRMLRFDELCEELKSVWGPRLDALAKRFGDHVKVEPHITPEQRAVTMDFQSPYARVSLKFSASTDLEVQNLVLSRDLEILPVYIRFEPHVEQAIPLDQVNPEVVGQWLDDRIVDFVHIYLSLHECEYYLRDHMVEDPVAHVRLPDFAAGAKLDWKGKTYYFLGEETRAQFAQENGIAAR